MWCESRCVLVCVARKVCVWVKCGVSLGKGIVARCSSSPLQHPPLHLSTSTSSKNCNTPAHIIIHTTLFLQHTVTHTTGGHTAFVTPAHIASPFLQHTLLLHPDESSPYAVNMLQSIQLLEHSKSQWLYL